ncbi:MAG: site-specific DNA-methyltransferase [Planctomycetota bacterium]|jgi:DNA modification methylase
MDVRKIPIDQLNPAPYNPRVNLKPGDPVYERLKRSVDEFGYVEPIVVNRRTNNVVGGHQRLKVLKDLGNKEIDVVFVDLTEEREKALNLALNKIVGDWDEPKLAQLLQEFEGFPDVDVWLTGFDDREIGDVISRVLDRHAIAGNDDQFDVDAALDEQQPAITQPGELIELGDHRLLCGDSTKVKDVQRLMNGERATLFATDPPYLVGYDGTNHPGSRGQRDKNKNWSSSYGVTWDDAEANPDLYENFYRVAVAEAVTPNAAWYCWHASRRQAMVEDVWNKFGAFVHQQIIWVKDRPILTRSWYSWQHEPCFFGWVRPNQPDRVANDFLSSVWHISTVAVGQRTDHPTSKPVEVFAIPMRQHTRRRDVCYEPFCGSGSQLIAAEQLGRRCYALEISPHYCDVIVRRWIHFVGEHRAPLDLVERYRLARREEVTA